MCFNSYSYAFKRGSSGSIYPCILPSAASVAVSRHSETASFAEKTAANELTLPCFLVSCRHQR
jgi:hypothetical protein